MTAGSPLGVPLLGVSGSGALARVDAAGAVHAPGMSVDWWVGADDCWHLPAEEASTVQHRPGPAPVIETAVRVPGGQVRHRAYGARAGTDAVVAIDLENASPAPLTVVLVVTVPGRGEVTVDGAVVRVAGAPELHLPRAPRGWAAGASTRAAVTGGAAKTGAVEPQRGPVELALLFPVPHRVVLRAAVGGDAIDARELPAPDAVARGWELHLERGMQAELPPPFADRVDAARADLLLGAPGDPSVVAALEDWGFDAEAAAAWAGLGWRARRRARARAHPADPWAALRVTPAGDPAAFLTALRAVLVREGRDTVDLLPGFPPDWLGQSLGASAVPVRGGSLSFAVRWHGARPALLWEAPPGVELRLPALDPSWSTTVPTGEALLAEPPATLLPMGGTARADGTPISAPGQFS